MCDGYVLISNILKVIQTKTPVLDELVVERLQLRVESPPRRPRRDVCVNIWLLVKDRPMVQSEVVRAGTRSEILRHAPI